MKLALPKGRLQSATAELLEKAGIKLSDYQAPSRSYRPTCQTVPNLLVKVFQEKDIAIQVAVGNYDLGICGLDWVEELLVKYPASPLAKVRNLGYGNLNLYAVASRFSGPCSLDELKTMAREGGIRIVSEYPNLAESFALRQRFGRFKLFPVWGAAEAYPSENADLAITPETSERRLRAKGLVAVAKMLTSTAFLIANRNSLQRIDLSDVLGPLCALEVGAGEVEVPAPIARTSHRHQTPGGEWVWLALPDGHQQRHAVEFLEEAGLKIQGYHKQSATRRPSVTVDGVAVKVIRPQDMPLQVANGNFDLAITGQDWLRDHLYRFPSSPVKELIELGFGKVRIVAVVSRDLPAASVEDLRRLIKAGGLPYLRLASEYVNIADKYARDNHLAPYKVIPTWGASEGFLPEDADVLIENAETGGTLARHNLKIIDTLFWSSACLIGYREPSAAPAKMEKMARIIETLARAV